MLPASDLQRYKWYIGTGPTLKNENKGPTFFKFEGPTCTSWTATGYLDINPSSREISFFAVMFWTIDRGKNKKNIYCTYTALITHQYVVKMGWKKPHLHES